MFIDKLNKKQEGVYSLEEEKTIVDGKWKGYLNHDNVNPETIYIYTEEKFGGDRVENYFISTSAEMPWKLYLKVFSKSEKIHITYESAGDQGEADDMNLIQDVISTIKGDLEGYKDSNDKEVSDLKNNKVDKIEGKGLSTENYTTSDKDKLSKIEPGSNKYTHPDIHSAAMIVDNKEKRFVSDTEKAKWNKVEEKADKIYVDKTFATKEEIGESGQGDMKKSVYDINNNGVIDKADSVPWAGVTGKPDGSTTAKGVVQLSNSVTSTSQSLAATPYAIKQVMDKASQAFQSVSDGKKLIATAITDKGVNTSGSDTFSKMASNIGTISVGIPAPVGFIEDAGYHTTQAINYKSQTSIFQNPSYIRLYNFQGTMFKEIKVDSGIFQFAGVSIDVFYYYRLFGDGFLNVMDANGTILYIANIGSGVSDAKDHLPIVTKDYYVNMKDLYSKNGVLLETNFIEGFRTEFYFKHYQAENFVMLSSGDTESKTYTYLIDGTDIPIIVGKRKGSLSTIYF